MEAESTRVCGRCKIAKPHSGFSSSKNPSVWCRACCRENAAAWRARNRERVLEGDRARSGRYQATPEGRLWMFEYRLLTKYGLTREAYDALVISQTGRCALCERHDDVLVVDHCHDTGRVRGLLCKRCNVSLGGVGDTEAAVRRLLAYVQNGELTDHMG